MALPVNLTFLAAGPLGFAHGFDYDHIAAISDITSVQNSAGRAIKLGLIYASGHAASVALLGSVYILFQPSLPQAINRIVEILVGITLAGLAIFVLACILLRRHSHSGSSRILLLIATVRWLGWRFRRWRNPQLTAPTSFTWNYGRRSVFMVGVIHGFGAETPTQLLLFLLAANLGGIGNGFLGLTMFLAGLLLMNTLMTATAAGLFQVCPANGRIRYALMGVTAAYSLAIGVMFVLGSSSMLPWLGER